MCTNLWVGQRPISTRATRERSWGGERRVQCLGNGGSSRASCYLTRPSFGPCASRSPALVHHARRSLDRPSAAKPLARTEPETPNGPRPHVAAAPPSFVRPAHRLRPSCSGVVAKAAPPCGVEADRGRPGAHRARSPPSWSSCVGFVSFVVDSDRNCFSPPSNHHTAQGGVAAEALPIP